ncbi:MAG: prepilin peptidase [Butyrivibrio sp.]|nr:prepilin peptidase [Butyrivibrio sp.]
MINCATCQKAPRGFTKKIGHDRFLKRELANLHYERGDDLIQVLLFLLLSGAAFTDLYKDKIYNFWVIPGLLAGIVFAAFGGIDPLINSLAAVITAFALLIPVYLFKGIAAGDVKLSMAAASFLSVQDTVSSIIIAFLVAGVISLAVLIIKRNKKHKIHFAVPVLVSVLFTLGGVV